MAMSWVPMKGYVEDNKNRLSHKIHRYRGVGELIEPVDSHEPKSWLDAEISFYAS